ncbi:hypothetical protein B0H14DRAFT_3721477 [Mycena olivaceomarginata]|nr:hypothetical protein B0H14DRAFT_3721477 [Mycena olivaceomarginata]
MDGSQPPVLPSELEREISKSPLVLVLNLYRDSSWLRGMLSRGYIYFLLGGLERPILSKDIMFPILHSRPQLLHHARNLLLPFSSIDDGHLILPHCQRIENLGLSTSYKAHPHLFSLVLTLPLKRFYGALGPLFGSLPRVDRTHQFFAQITHLGLCDYPCEIVDSEFWSGLPLIPNLTHFSLDSAWLDAFSRVLRTCPSLRVLVGIGLPMYEGPPPGLGTLPNDPRFVMMDLDSEGQRLANRHTYRKRLPGREPKILSQRERLGLSILCNIN